MGALHWDDATVRQVLGLGSGDSAEVEYTGVSTDSRTVEEGDLFVALRGPNFDGHEFVDAALASGARGVVVSEIVGVNAPSYRVEDTLIALGRLAAHRRDELGARVVGVTGSSGKTGTRELIRAALGETRRVHATSGNLNNRIGLPLTILSAPEHTEILVLEMGTSEPGEIAALTRIARPDIAVVTTVSESHLDGLGDLEGVLAEKLAIFDHLGEDGVALVGDEPPALVEAARERVPDLRVAGFGPLASETLRPHESQLNDEGQWSIVWRGVPVRIRVPGRHAVTNALLALGAAEVLDVEPDVAAAGISAVAAGSLRGEMLRVGPITLLLDCYNANPQSTRAALEVLESLRGAHPNRVAVLGTMLELGDRSESLHREVLADAMSAAPEVLVATGEFARAARDSGTPHGPDAPKLIVEDDPLEAYEQLRSELEGEALVLLKASRGVALERLVPLFERDFGEGEGG